MKKVLVTGAGAVLGQGIIKSLRRANEPFFIIAADPSPLATALYWADESAIIPMASANDWSNEIEMLLDRARPDIVFVGTDVELKRFAQKRKQWEKQFGTRIVVSDESVIEVADDKYSTANFLKRNGLSHAASALPENKEDLQELVEHHGFPLIVKPRQGARSVGVSLVNNRPQLKSALENRRGLVVQQWAGPEDQEYTAGVICFDGAVQAQITLRRDLRDGNTYRAYASSYPDADDYVRRVASALSPFGPANFQFRRGLDGEFRIFEINARFSGTTPMRTMLGFNEIEMCVRHLTSNEKITQPQISHGIVLRYLHEQFIPEKLIIRKHS